uniref:Related to transcription regulator SPT7 n=1 Tax=Melanopsichium pennsylvanicum 4 TaxID=1398559 RepID=A0A077R7X2_9BASI|nr:related to transcription regulator SPT7 [Melanopsichium pennsylvanicum 4]
MKYLLQAISSKRSSVKLGDDELRDLLTEVCKGRDEREEFLESIDRIITELKNYTEHSTAFLSKVSKRDAPDYYEVIKHPMDLGTMQKKVKSGQYKSKKQFAHDLNMIWDNCLLYNSDPMHPLRRNVQFMRKKANHLLEFISDKSDVKDALVQWGSINPATTVSADANGVPKTTDGLVSGEAQQVEEKSKEEAIKVKRRRTEGDGKFEDQEAFIRSPQGMLEWGRIDAGLSVLEGPSSRPLIGPFAPVEAMDRIKESEEQEDPLSCVLGSIFPTSLHSKGKENKTPEPSQLQSRSQSQSQSQSQTPASTSSLDNNNVFSLDASANWFTVTASRRLMSSALPALPCSTVLTPSNETEGKVQGMKKRKKKPFHLVPATRRKGLQGKIARNIRTLQKVQETHNKFLSLAHYVENEAPIPAYLTSMSSDEESDYPSDPEDFGAPGLTSCSHHGLEAARNPFTRISAESARDHCAYNVQTMLAHQGFEGSHRVALDVLTDALGEFLGNLGRMLRLYSDRYSHTMSAEEMMLHTLQETLRTDVHSLETYIRNDVERYGSKMTDLLRKLRASYKEQFNLSTERATIEDEALFADNAEALVVGNWAEDLGDDYFGFRELGLDKEVGLGGLTVPSRLFYGRNRGGGVGGAGLVRGGLGDGTKDNVLPYPPPPEPIPLVTAAVDDQIGLLRGFYQDKLREHRNRLKHQDAALLANKNNNNSKQGVGEGKGEERDDDGHGETKVQGSTHGQNAKEVDMECNSGE